MTDFYGLPTQTIGNDHIRVEYLVEAGLRVVRLFVANSACSENFLAETPGVSWDTPYGPYFLRGGHRLWHAPEGVPRSSIPEPRELDVQALSDGVRLSQPAEPETGIRKELELRVSPGRPALTVKHKLCNDGLWPVELAPWAISQLALGGVAILPQPIGSIDPHGLRPNRCLVLWPYTTLADPRVELYDDYWLVHGRPQLPPCKIGYLNRCGWLGYLRNDVVLIKRFRPHEERPHADSGCNVEVHCGEICLELETLAPLCYLAPGHSAAHVEQWEFFTGVNSPSTRDGIRTMVSLLPPQSLAPLYNEKPANYPGEP
jgi:hypothetical protein